MKYTLKDFLELKNSFSSIKKVRILSGSMEPFIYKDDVVLITPKNVDLLKKGDVIVFWKDDKLICHLFHRFERVENQNCLITKGINSKTFDRPIPKKFYLGLLVEPKVTLIKSFFFRLYLLFSR